MKLLLTAIFAGVMAMSTAVYANNHEKKDEPVYKTVCLDVQGKDGKPVMDPKTNKPKQNCTKVRVREKFEGTKIEGAPKK